MEMSTSSPTTVSRNSKLRASCDRCQDQKVKCSRDKPTCLRCIKKGSACIYSPLRPMGRPRKSQQTADEAKASPHGLRHERQRMIDDVQHQPSLAKSLPNNGTVNNDTGGGGIAGPELDCCTVILARTLRLSLATQTSFSVQQTATAAPAAEPIPQHSKMELVLEAERDFRLLKSRLFAFHTCMVHRTYSRVPCLVDPDRPVLLSLALFGERVVSIFEWGVEDVRKRGLLETSYSADATSVGAWGQSLSHGGDERVQDIGFRIADYTLGDGHFDGGQQPEHQLVSRGRALRRIVQVRIRKLLGALEGIREEAAKPVVAAMRPEWAADGADNIPVQGGVAVVMKDAVLRLMEDSIRRMERLQAQVLIHR
ncbi:hypothetical protein B0H66DRAFT_561522 [Apodospora peruviana]|uniref:Zn(2)-C6 fungal-type domain-containing protein n=1 Tax=Apodospora peruviana TaxID=516989 RepID=A0AAE0M2N4_9PEZI|nr:hypothetical protein B0H66DRAFT_561522 [Apodospora peruviana]